VIRLDCPACKKDSYSAAVEPFRPCPYCGVVYSGKHGLEKRDEQRIQREVPFAFSYLDDTIDATTFDVTKKGVGLKFFRSLSILDGDEIDLHINSGFAKAQVRWIKNNKELSITTAGCTILSGSLHI
jgi:hypothetical protein